jgi:hypothetical protein
MLLLLLSDGVFEDGYFFLVAEVELGDGVGEFEFVLFELFDSGFQLVLLRVLVVIHLNYTVNYK